MRRLDPNGYHVAPEGVPNPYRPRLHNWKGGPYNEGNLFHGPNYTEPQFGLPGIRQPIWQYGPPGVAGLSGADDNIGEYDMYHASDVRTRGGSFSPRGFGGGIFNLNTALGADTAPAGRTPDPAQAVIWGLPDPRFSVIQGKLNAVLIVNGKSPIPMDGVLNEGFCSACRSLPDASFKAFLNSTTQAEADMAYLALLQCMVNGYIDPSALPCEVPGSKNPNCGGVIPPQPQPPQPPRPGQGCPAGQFPNPMTGQCEMIPVIPGLPSAGCLPGMVLDPGTGLCKLPGGGLPSLPSLPGVPAKTCPPGQKLDPASNTCELISVLPPVKPACAPGFAIDPKTGTCVYQQGVEPSKPATVCQEGTKFDPSTGLCKKVTPTPAATTDNTLYWVLGGVALVGIGAGIWAYRKNARKGR